jgi:hypothetical protein
MAKHIAGYSYNLERCTVNDLRYSCKSLHSKLIEEILIELDIFLTLFFKCLSKVLEFLI